MPKNATTSYCRLFSQPCKPWITHLHFQSYHHKKIHLQHKRNRTVFEKMKGKQKLMEILTDYFDNYVVPAFAKLQRLSRKHLLNKAAQLPISPGRPVSMAHGVAPPLPKTEPGGKRPVSMMPASSRPPLPIKNTSSRSSKSKSAKYSKNGVVRLTRGQL